MRIHRVVPNIKATRYTAASVWKAIVTASPNWMSFAQSKGYTPSPKFMEQADAWIAEGDGEDPISVPPGDPDPTINAERMNWAVSKRVQNGSIVIMHANGRGWYTRARGIQHASFQHC